MDACLPDEVLHEILSYNITVSHSVFLKFSGNRRRSGSRLKRHSDLLIVSKRWLRIGTPLLYECLKLTRPAHTRSVAALFRAQPHVGLAVRCIRLQGGLGRDLVHVAKCTPRLQHLFLDPQLKSADSITGLKKAFTLFRPAHLYLERDFAHWQPNKKVAAAWQLLYEYMREGTALRTLALAHHFRGMNDEFADALAASSVEELTCSTSQAEKWIAGSEMRRILASPRLQRVVCRGALIPEHMRRVLLANGFSDADVRKFSFVEGPMNVSMGRGFFKGIKEPEFLSSSDEDA